MLKDSRSFHLKSYFVVGLTLVRVPLILLFLCVSVFGGHPLPAPWFIVAFSAMILSALTDLFDGCFARRLKVTSRLAVTPIR
jgi:phosphatidylglycerophosphate synthase